MLRTESAQKKAGGVEADEGDEGLVTAEGCMNGGWRKLAVGSDKGNGGT